ncbi:hypothetical protein QAD02_017357 [Eretmocerus hayati]|uniref:Uncharacterized protein n=1 Tax=Eretmocerus hayati TaxID=131215 RepID=A0ACC2PDA5_9HYME|nr:hypothetical protein QAD02_017357 [Eretmocerus hayati]
MSNIAASTSVLGPLEEATSGIMSQLLQLNIGDRMEPKSVDGEKEDNPYGVPQAPALLSRGHYERARHQLRRQFADSKTHPQGITEEARSRKGGKDRRIAKDSSKDADAELLRLLRESGPGRSFSRTRYVGNSRSLSRWRLLTGQKRDACIRLEQQMHLEHRKYLAIKEEYRRCVGAVESYLASEHEASMRLMSEADAQQRLTRQLSERRDELSRRYGQARLDVYHWEEAWRTVKACQRFLLRVLKRSPDHAHHHDNDDPAHWHLDGNQPDGDNDGPLLLGLEPIGEQSIDGSQVSLSRDTIAEEASLEALIAAFERETSRLASRGHQRLVLPAEMGLCSADDLLKRFRDIEEQNLNALIHLETLGGPMAEMISRIEEAEGQVKREIDDVLGVIRGLEVSIEREEARAERLEARSAELVQRAFRALVCSERSLQAKVLLDDAYESCLGSNEAQLGPLGMARALESRYERLSAELDSLPRPLVLAAERQGFKQQLRDSHEFSDALAKYELMQRLIAALRRLMEPNEPRRRKLMYRSKPRLTGVKLAHEQDAPADVEAVASAETDAHLEAAEHLGLFSEPCANGQDQDQPLDGHTDD